ncbi:hypothetical protein [Paenibacillus cymbidii]|uniref:hypothetical protein n=1 Tax=Paenibacillus cymbidii TaxID=1639034 RepID=UPI001080938A|nr:hypothetical protein [Paenibacillus cymbidii]
MDQQSAQELRKKRFLSALGLPIFGVLAYVWLNDDELLLGAGSLLCVLFSIAAVIKLSRQLRGSMSVYRPGKGFWYYRLTRQNKLHYLTAGEAVIVLIAAGLLLFTEVPVYFTLLPAAAGLYSLHFVVKPRIRLHTPVDDASLFELEELGIIGMNETVLGLYKDFEQWAYVTDGDKIVVLTNDQLVIVRLSGPESGERISVSLRDIHRLGILSSGNAGQGLNVVIGLSDETVVRFLLHGESFQDSPEEFVHQLLQSLDALAFQRLAPASGQRHRPESGGRQERPAPSEHRKLDLYDHPAAASGIPASAPSGQRVLDF